MAVRKQPLRIVTYSGPDPEIALNNEQFEALETAYERPIDATARQHLQQNCNEFLSHKRVEKIRQTWRDVEDQIHPYKDLARSIWTVAYEQDRRSDAFHEFEYILESVLDQQMLRFDAKNELFSFDPENADAGIVPLANDYELPDRPYFIKLSDQLIQEIAMVLSVAVNVAQKRIAEAAEKEVDDGSSVEPIDAFILSMTQWAKIHDLPFASASTREGYDPAPFSKFMTKLLSVMPEPFRETNYSTAGGMEAKIKRVRAAYKKRR
ncbi:hypothetical protein ACFSE0_07620 [Ochrobactrum teleogrylli]|uniref:Uncharacterized protein n=1 Tax=Ochrobactrum teleogrylli TaxID=2479765 RepID=A0ABY2Y1U2_9HYPH|nr:hypothetical protein [[Ochrobactrum] teleogrylli]TNV13257.1 hypothetical protein FIC94_16105 [[Ochrobactrum] teleogrylli]